MFLPIWKKRTWSSSKRPWDMNLCPGQPERSKLTLTSFKMEISWQFCDSMVSTQSLCTDLVPMLVTAPWHSDLMASFTSSSRKLPGTGQPSHFSALSGLTGLTMPKTLASMFHGYRSERMFEPILTHRLPKTSFSRLKVFPTVSITSFTVGLTLPETTCLAYSLMSLCQSSSV